MKTDIVNSNWAPQLVLCQLTVQLLTCFICIQVSSCSRVTELCHVLMQMLHSKICLDPGAQFHACQQLSSWLSWSVDPGYNGSQQSENSDRGLRYELSDVIPCPCVWLHFNSPGSFRRVSDGLPRGHIIMHIHLHLGLVRTYKQEQEQMLFKLSYVKSHFFFFVIRTSWTNM